MTGNPPDKKVRPQGWREKPPVRVPGKPDPGRVDLDLAKFDKLLLTKGTRVKVFRTLSCPNVLSVDGGEHSPDCDLCNGSGWLDVHPIECIAFIQNQNLEKMILPEGLADGNTISATFERGVELQYFTLVELRDYTEIFYQRVKRQDGNLDVLKYKALVINVCADARKEYYVDSDFKLDPNGSILWLPGRGPDPGTIYSVHYEAAVQFRAVRAMHVNRFTQVFVPDNGGQVAHVKAHEQWMLAKEFLVRRRDLNGNEILPNLIHPKTGPDDPEDPYQS